MTPQQENELLPLPCPFCNSKASMVGAYKSWVVNCTECDAYSPSMGSKAESVAAWNRRAPAPTEPAVDRDARNAQRAIADIRRFVNESSDKNLGMWIDDDIDTLTAYLATPASPAVPAAPTTILPTNESEK